MKKCLFNFIALLAIWFSYSCSSGGGNTISVKLINAGEGYAYLKYFDPTERKYVTIDSINQADAFTFKLDSAKMGVYSIFTDDRSICNIYNCEPTMNVQVEVDRYRRIATVKGSKMNDQINSYREGLEPLTKTASNLIERYNSCLKSGYCINFDDSVKVINDLEEQNRLKIVEYNKAALEKYSGTLTGAYLGTIIEGSVKRTTPEYLTVAINKYWDAMPFYDSRTALFPAIKERLVQYVPATMNIPERLAIIEINRFLDSCSKVPGLYKESMNAFTTIYGDKSRPSRNQKSYKSILEHLLNSPLYSDLEKEPYRYKLEMVKNHLPGTYMAPLDLVNENGARVDPSNSKTRWTILYFHNPGCENCKETSKLLASLCLGALIDRGQLTVYTIYLGDDIDAWKKTIKETEFQKWVNLRDDKKLIDNLKLYDVGAIPMIYLIDQDKRIRVKDAISYELCTGIYSREEGRIVDDLILEEEN